MAEIQAPTAMLALYHLTQKPEYLESGTKMLDYLLLTQQVWNNPLYTPMLVGGFTTQNTDQEWSDARQGYAAIVLADYYDATGNFEYLERAIAAARSTFAVAPSENWAHSGYPDEPGGISSYHWGTGSAMTSVEIMSPKFGDALIDLHAQRGVGFDQCTITDVDITGDTISFRIFSSARERQFLVRFRGIDAGTPVPYRLERECNRRGSGGRTLKEWAARRAAQIGLARSTLFAWSSPALLMRMPQRKMSTRRTSWM